MDESTPGILERARERIHRSQEVKFHNGIRMVASTHGDKPTIRLLRDKKIVEDLRSYLPDETVVKIHPEGKWKADIERATSKPLLLMGKINGVYAIADFLHEGGHLLFPELTDIALTAESRYASLLYRQHTSKKKIPELSQAFDQSHEEKLRAERSAWAFALRVIRQIDQKHGIDIINRMGGIDGVLKYVNCFLGQYEQQALTDLKDLGSEVYSKTQMEELLLAKMNQ